MLTTGQSFVVGSRLEPSEVFTVWCSILLSTVWFKKLTYWYIITLAAFTVRKNKINCQRFITVITAFIRTTCSRREVKVRIHTCLKETVTYSQVLSLLNDKTCQSPWTHSFQQPVSSFQYHQLCPLLLAALHVYTRLFPAMYGNVRLSPLTLPIDLVPAGCTAVHAILYFTAFRLSPWCSVNKKKMS